MRRLLVDDEESDGAQSGREPAASDHSAPETTDQPAYLSASLPGFSARGAAYTDRFDVQRLTPLAPRSALFTINDFPNNNDRLFSPITGPSFCTNYRNLQIFFQL